MNDLCKLAKILISIDGVPDTESSVRQKGDRNDFSFDYMYLFQYNFTNIILILVIDILVHVIPGQIPALLTPLLDMRTRCLVMPLYMF